MKSLIIDRRRGKIDERVRRWKDESRTCFSRTGRANEIQPHTRLSNMTKQVIRLGIQQLEILGFVSDILSTIPGLLGLVSSVTRLAVFPCFR